MLEYKDIAIILIIIFCGAIIGYILSNKYGQVNLKIINNDAIPIKNKKESKIK